MTCVTTSFRWRLAWPASGCSCRRCHDFKRPRFFSVLACTWILKNAVCLLCFRYVRELCQNELVLVISRRVSFQSAPILRIVSLFCVAWHFYRFLVPPFSILLHDIIRLSVSTCCLIHFLKYSHTIHALPLSVLSGVSDSSMYAETFTRFDARHVCPQEEVSPSALALRSGCHFHSMWQTRRAR